MLFKNFLLATISITALPTDIAKGLPPKVDPWEPAIIPDATFLFIKTAPIGNPPPIPFAIGTISGFIFELSKAKKSPDLPTPHWTSSRINNIFLIQAFDKERNYSESAVYTRKRVNLLMKLQPI